MSLEIHDPNKMKGAKDNMGTEKTFGDDNQTASFEHPEDALQAANDVLNTQNSTPAAYLFDMGPLDAETAR